VENHFIVIQSYNAVALSVERGNHLKLNKKLMTKKTEPKINDIVKIIVNYGYGKKEVIGQLEGYSREETGTYILLSNNQRIFADSIVDWKILENNN
jgi:hypothetical protein